MPYSASEELAFQRYVREMEAKLQIVPSHMYEAALTAYRRLEEENAELRREHKLCGHVLESAKRECDRLRSLTVELKRAFHIALGIASALAVACGCLWMAWRWA